MPILSFAAAAKTISLLPKTTTKILALPEGTGTRSYGHVAGTCRKVGTPRAPIRREDARSFIFLSAPFGPTPGAPTLCASAIAAPVTPSASLLTRCETRFHNLMLHPSKRSREPAERQRPLARNLMAARPSVLFASRSAAGSSGRANKAIIWGSLAPLLAAIRRCYARFWLASLVSGSGFDSIAVSMRLTSSRAHSSLIATDGTLSVTKISMSRR